MKNSKVIKSTKWVVALIICSSLVTFSSCDEADESIDAGVEVTLTDDELVEIGVASESAADEILEDVDDIAEEAVADLNNVSGARRGVGFRDCGERTIEEDTVNEITTITITFDGTCTSPRGNRVRTGTIVIVKEGQRNEPGAKHTLTFEDFFVDSVQVEGVRTYENLSSAEDESIVSISATLTGGKLTFPDETFATREAISTRVRDKGAETVTVTGNASGVSREGSVYSSEITTALIFDKSCEDTFIPVEGVKVIIKDGVETSKDYGDGTCDNLVTITTDGESEEIEVESRKRFPRARDLFLKRRR